MLKSARDHGIKVQDNSQDADAVLLWSVLWTGRMRANRDIYEHYQASGRPVIIAEVGALRRNHTWKIAVDNVTRVGYYGHEQDLDPDRPRKLGLAIQRTTNRADHVMIACQNSHSLQMAAVGDQAAWIQERITEIRRYSDRPIRVRPHPRSPLAITARAKAVTIEIPRKIAHTYDDFDLDLNCHAVVNINSGPGILAPLSSTPVMVDRTSLAWPINMTVQDIESPPDVDRDRWLIQMSHTEYLISEIEQGLWLRRLQSRL